jgi:phosphohistidine swiveling domain-containing protein
LGAGIQGILPHPIRKALVLPENKLQAIYFPEAEYEMFLQMLRENYIENLDGLKQYILVFLKFGNSYVEEVSRLAKDIHSQSDEKLLRRYKLFFDALEHFSAHLWVTFYINELMSEKVVKTINQLSISEDEKEKLLYYALNPSELAGALLLAHEAIKKDVSSLIRDFSWLTTIDIHTDPASKQDIEVRVIGVHETSTVVPDVFDSLADDVREMILCSKRVTYIKDVRDDFRRKGFCASLPIFDVIASRAGCTRYDLSYLAYDEVVSLLNGSGDRNDIIAHARKRRAEGFAFSVDDRSFVIEDDVVEMQKIARRNKIDTVGSTDVNVKEIKGIIGQKGKVQGVVVLVNVVEELKKVTEGSILCTVTTNVDYLSAMQKAIAFITDEGGITCHAAIVAREMKKPCIIGTKIATQVLHDGDLVEVDADKGVVKILERMGENKDDSVVDMTGWDIVPEAGRAAWMYVIHTVGRYFAQPHQKWGIITGGVVQNKNNKLQLFLTVKDNSKFEFTLQRFINDDQLLDEVEQFITDTKNATIKNLHSKPLSSISNDQLAEVSEMYFSQYTDMHRIALILRLLDRGCILKLREIFSQEKNADELIAQVVIADRPTFSIQEEIKILKLANKIVRSGKTVTAFTSEIEVIMNSYKWLTLGYFDEKMKNYEDYEKKLTHILANNPRQALQLLEDRIAADIKIRDEIIARFKSKDDRKVMAIAGESTYLKDYFKFSINEMQLYGEALFEEISTRTGLSVSTLKNLMHDEIIGLLKGRSADLSLAKERIRHCVFVGKYDGHLHTMIGEAADIFEARYLTLVQDGQKNFKGRSACKGHVTAIAKVVLNNDDFKKINQGDILVVMNTSPDFVPVLGKSSAIVAEEGGITSHVSVISRELNIPCVVGIPRITQAIKDGDLVEVDANKGVVKILKRVSS